MSRVFKSGSAEARAYDWEAEGPVVSDEVQPLLEEAPAASDPQEEQVQEAPPAAPLVDLERIRKQAFEEGFQAGKEATQQTCEQAYAEQLAHFGAITEHAVQFKKTLRGAVEAEVTDLAFAVARRILRRELQTDPEATLGVVKAGMERASGGEVQQIRVHPDDFEMVRAEVDEAVEVIADQSVTAGGALFETREGRLDARIETQLEEIERGLADR